MAKGADLLDIPSPHVLGDENMNVNLWPGDSSHSGEADENNGWTKRNEALLEEVSLKCIILAHIHARLHLQYDRWNTWFNLALISTSVLESFLVSTDLFTTIGGGGSMYVKIAVQLLSFFTTFFTIVNRYLAYNVRSERYRRCEIKLYDIYHSIQIQLVTENTARRANGLTFLKWAITNFARFQREGEPIPDAMLKAGLEDYRKEQGILHFDRVNVHELSESSTPEHPDVTDEMHSYVSNNLHIAAPPLSRYSSNRGLPMLNARLRDQTQEEPLRDCTSPP
ncbi:hypothetical protein GGF32_002699 [Allomyces javanicus]|nr:hypothetical protein GGF32_002699 [Allomyces javanicus]